MIKKTALQFMKGFFLPQCKIYTFVLIRKYAEKSFFKLQSD